MTLKKLRSGLQVGKMEVSWKEIKEAIGTLNIELNEWEEVNNSKVEEVKKGSCSVRKKRGERELLNLKCSIDYDKSSKDKGLGGDL